MTPNKLVSMLRVALGCLSGGFLVALMAVTVVDVFGRYILNMPLLGAYELSETGIGIVVAAALPLVALDDGHIRLTLLDRQLGRRAVRWRDGVSAILFTVASGVLAWRMAVELQNAASLGGSTDLPGPDPRRHLPDVRARGADRPAQPVPAPRHGTSFRHRAARPRRTWLKARSAAASFWRCCCWACPSRWPWASSAWWASPSSPAGTRRWR
jgi:hypothetical protein